MAVIAKVLAALAVAAGAWLIWNLSKLLRNVYQTFRHGQNAAMANRIRLIECADPEWHNRRGVEGRARELRGHGFEALAVYRIAEIQNLFWSVYLRPSDGTIAAISDHELLGVFVEFVVKYTDGSSLTVSDGTKAGGFDAMPRHEKHFVDATQPELLELVERRRKDAPVVRFDKDSLARDVEATFAEEMQWRNDRGGLRPEEIARNQEGWGKNLSTEVATEVAEICNTAHFARVREECLATYLDEEGVSIAAYEEMRDRLLVVLKSDRLHDIAGELCMRYELDAEQQARLKALAAQDESASERFSQMYSAIFPQGCRARHVRRPAEADIYLLPVRS